MLIISIGLIMLAVADGSTELFIFGCLAFLVNMITSKEEV